MRQKFVLMLVCLLSAALLSSCALLPQEESIQTAPVVKTYTRPEYETAQVERGDLVQKITVTCNYVPVQSANLSFALDAEYIDRYFVQAGDSVTEGQLLAQLQLGDLEARIRSVENDIAVLELKLEYQQKRFVLEQKQLEVTTRDMDPVAKAEAIQQAQESREAQARTLQDSLVLKQLSLEALQKDLAQRQIRAPFSGTVTRVAKFNDGDRSEFGVGVITVVDSTRSVFRAHTEQWDCFEMGGSYDIVVGKETYPAVVVSEEELGLAPQKREKGKRSYVYLALLQPTFDLEEGDNGKVEIVQDARLDVLHVPVKAVSSANGQPIVYYLREDGMKAYKPVEVGITLNKRIEIISGVEEGETIVVK